jgi:small-conductance mechanosensitive channel
MARSRPTAAARQVHQDEEVKKALAQAAPGEQERRTGGRAGRIWLLVFGSLSLVFGVLAYLEQADRLPLPGSLFGILHRVPLTAFAISFVLFLERLGEAFAIRRIGNAVTRYNATRIARLLAAGLIVAALASVLFSSLYTGLVSLGVISLIVGLSVQTPMTSFIGWLYILVRAPYRVGDRIQIGNATGDVIEVSYLDTTLWEFGGKYLSSDHPSGRIIKFPNSQVLSNPVYNYSWPLFPYIWNEIRFQISYDSDLEFVGKTMREVAEEELGKEMVERVAVYRELLSKTPVDELTVQERPVVLFRVNDNTWLEAIVRYLVDPKRAGRVKTELIRKLLARLNAAPDRVGFPKGNSR